MQKGQQISDSARQKLQDDALEQKDQRRRPHTEEHKRKISVALVGRKHSQATKQKMRAAAQGRKHSDAAKLKMSLTRRGRPAPWVSERMLGSTRPMSPEAYAALSRRNKKRALPPDERRRRRQEISRHCQLKARYGLSAAEYDHLLALQRNVCRICRKPCSTGKRLAVDHDHETGKVRGLLCRRCNRGLGHFPTANLLRSALAYQESYPYSQREKLAIGEARILTPESP